MSPPAGIHPRFCHSDAGGISRAAVCDGCRRLAILSFCPDSLVSLTSVLSYNESHANTKWTKLCGQMRESTSWHWSSDSMSLA